MKIVLKRSEVAGKIPSTDDLSLGELAINTADGTLYTKKSVNGVESVIQVGAAAGSGSSNPGTGSGNLDPNSPAMNSITPTGYGQHVGLPDATLMSQAATNLFTIVNESPTYNLGIRDSAGTLRRVIPPLGQCNIGLKDKTSATDGWTYNMIDGDGAVLPLAETYIASQIFRSTTTTDSQVRFGNTMVAVGFVDAQPTGAIYLLAGDLTTGNVSAPVGAVPADTAAVGTQICKLTETTGVLMVRTSGTIRMVYFELVGPASFNIGPLYSEPWADTYNWPTEIGQFVPNSSTSFLLTYTAGGQSYYYTNARYFTVTGNVISSGPSSQIVTGSDSRNSAINRHTELVSGNTFFNYGTADSANYNGYSLTIAGGGSAPVGQQVITTTSSFVVPAGVTTLSAVAVGAGSGGGWGDSTNGAGNGGSGGCLRWMSGVPVTPGEILTVTVGVGGTGKSSGNNVASPGGDTYIQRGTTVLMRAGGGTSTGVSTVSSTTGAMPGGGTMGGGLGGKGGFGGSSSQPGRGGGGGGAGGYSGNGGDGGGGHIGSAPTSGTGGAGAGGVFGNTIVTTAGGGGGGVGLLGAGASGVALQSSGNNGKGGPAGSGGTNGGDATFTDSGTGNICRGGIGGTYGAGGGGGSYDTQNRGGNGGNGAVRIIWGAGRTYPSTNVVDQPTVAGANSITVGSVVNMAISSSQTVQTAIKPKAVRLPGTNMWVHFFLDPATSTSMAVQCWRFNGTALSLGPKFATTAFGAATSSYIFNTPVAYSSNIVLNAFQVGTSPTTSYGILGAVMILPDGTPSLVATQTTDYISTFNSADIISYNAATTPNIITRWKFNGANFETVSTSYYGPADYQITASNVFSLDVPQVRAQRSYVTPLTPNGVIKTIHNGKMKYTILPKTLNTVIAASPTDAKVGGFGVARNFIGTEAAKRVVFYSAEVPQPNVPVVATGVVNKPTITSPSYPIQTDTFIISTNGFGTTGTLGDVHLSTDFDVWAWDGSNQMGTKVWESLNNYVNKISVRLPIGVVAPNTPYTIRARHTGAALGTSEWGTTSIITGSIFAPTVPGTTYAGGFYAGRYQIGNDLYAIVVSPRSVEAWTTWGTQGPNSLFDGKANTDASTGPAATMAKALTTGGFNDWYIGSAYENDLIYNVFKPMTGDQVATGASPLGGIYGANPYTVPALTGPRTSTNPAQAADPAWRYGATGTAQTLPSEFGSSTAYNGTQPYYTYVMQPTTLNGSTSGAVQARAIGSPATYRPIRRVKLNFG